MPIRRPFNLDQWLEDHREELKPPVGNRNLYKESGDYIVMVVAGPNARKDYHYNDTEELFYQLEGNITVRIQEDGKAVDVKLGPGDMYLHPAKVPHSPMREAGSIGLVIERKREEGHSDGLLWFCDACNHKLHEVYFPLSDIEQDFTAPVTAMLDQFQPQGVVVQAVHAHVHQRDREAVPAAGAVQRPAPVEGNPPHGKPVGLDRIDRFDNRFERLCDAQFHIAGAEQASRLIVGAAAPLHAIFGEVELILKPQPIDEQVSVTPGTAARAAAVVVNKYHFEPVRTIQIIRVFQ